MNASSRLLAILAMTIVAGILTVLWFGFRSVGVGVDPGVAAGPESRASSLASEQEVAKSADASKHVGARMALPAVGERETDPQYTAALAAFTGRLVTHDGQPASDRLVQLVSIDARSLLTDRLVRGTDQPCEVELDAGEATSGADGRFTIQGAWPRACYLLIAAARADDQTHVIVERSPGPGETVDLGDIELEWAATITGALVDPAGKPVAGAYLRALDIPGIAVGAAHLELFAPGEAVIVGEGKDTSVVELPEWIEKRLAQLPMAVTKSDAEGKFRLGGVRAGSNLFTAIAPGLLAHVHPALRVKAGQTKDLGTLTLAEGETVQGRVRDVEDKPVQGAEVLVAPKSLGAPVHFARRAGASDGEGRFSLSGVSPGAVMVAARRDKTSAWTISGPHAGGSEPVVRLPAVHALTLAFVSKAGLPLDTPKVTLVRGSFGGVAIDMAAFGIARRVPLEGRSTRLEDGRLQIRDLVAGDYSLCVQAPGHAPAEVMLQLSADLERKIELDREASLVVRVVDSANKPVGRVSVHVKEEPGEDGLPHFVGKTDAEGLIVVKHAGAATKLDLLAQHPRYGVAEHTFALPTQDARIVLQAPGDLVGVVTQGGRPPQPGKWTIAVVPSGSGPDVPQMPRLATPDLEGRFVVRGLVPGSYTVATIPTLRALRSIGSVVTFGMNMAMNRGAEGECTCDADVRSGAVTEVRMELDKKPLDPTVPAGNVHGTVFLDGKPAVGIVVRGWNADHYHAVVDARGSFDLGRVRTGRMQLELSDPNADHGPLTALAMNELWQQSIEVKADADHAVDIQLRTGSISGQVLRADGAPAGHVFLVVRGLPAAEGGAAPLVPAACDDQGRFEIARLPEGKYAIVVEASAAGRGELRDVTVTAGVPQTGLEVRLRSTVNVRGTVDLKTFGAVTKHGVYVSLLTEKGEQVGGSRADEVGAQGTFTLDGVLPGTYRVRVWAWSDDRGREFEHATTIQVGDQGLDGLALVLHEVKSSDEGK